MSTLLLSMIDAPHGTRYEARHVDGKRFTVGRDKENDWVISDPERRISRCHCVFERGEDGWVVVDKSRNGIAHARGRNGQIVDPSGDDMPPGTLCTGDVLRLGDYALSVIVQDDDNSVQFRPLPSFLTRLRKSLAEGSAHRVEHDVDATQIMPLQEFQEMSSINAGAISHSGALKGAPKAFANDPLLDLLGLDSRSLTPERHAVALYRIASALDAVLRGMRSFPEISSNGSGASAYPLHEACSREEMLRWIAGLTTESPITPDVAIADMFERLRQHHDSARVANRVTARVLLNILNPENVSSGASIRRRVMSVTNLRRRYLWLRERLDSVVEVVYRRAYAASQNQKASSEVMKEEGVDAREIAS